MPITLDARVLASAYAATDALHLRAQHVLLQTFSGEHEVYLPCSLLTDVTFQLAVIFEQTGRDPLIAIGIRDSLVLDSQIHWVPIGKDFAYESAQFGDSRHLPVLDAYVAYTAYKYGCELLTTDVDYYESIASLVKVRHLGEMI